MALFFGLLAVFFSEVHSKTIRLKLNADLPYNLRQFHKGVPSVTGHRLGNNSLLEIDIPDSIKLPENPNLVNLQSVLSKWASKNPYGEIVGDDPKYFPIRILRAYPDHRAAMLPDGILALQHYLEKNGKHSITVEDVNATYNLDPECEWLEDLGLLYTSIHQRKRCQDFLVPSPFTSFRSLEDLSEDIVFDQRCILESMNQGRNLRDIRNNTKICDQESKIHDSLKIQCSTNETVDYLQKVLINVSDCFEIDPRHIFGIITQESRFHVNFQAPGGDTGLGQLTGIFVKELQSKYGDAFDDLTQLGVDMDRQGCESILKEYNENPLIFSNNKDGRCSWMNPVRNMAAIALEFRDTVAHQLQFFNQRKVDQFLENPNEIASIIALHLHHWPASVDIAKVFFTTEKFKRLKKKFHPGKIPTWDFLNQYKTTFGNNRGGLYLNQVISAVNSIEKTVNKSTNSPVSCTFF